MTLAVAEMYVQGVSTRKVTAIVQELCGLDITSTQVSRAAAELDEQLAAWRNRPIGEITCLARFSRPSGSAPNNEQLRAAQQGDQATDTGRNTLPERGVAPATRLCRPLRDQ
jgi:hypothetical protein